MLHTFSLGLLVPVCPCLSLFVLLSSLAGQHPTHPLSPGERRVVNETAKGKTKKIAEHNVSLIALPRLKEVRT